MNENPNEKYGLPATLYGIPIVVQSEEEWNAARNWESLLEKLCDGPIVIPNDAETG